MLLESFCRRLMVIMSIIVDMDTNNILSSKWTAQKVENKLKHFEVVSYDNKHKTVYLKPVLKGRSQLVSLEDLQDDTKWRTGWL